MLSLEIVRRFLVETRQNNVNYTISVCIPSVAVYIFIGEESVLKENDTVHFMSKIYLPSVLRNLDIFKQKVLFCRCVYLIIREPMDWFW
jgi:hypothetical protein